MIDIRIYDSLPNEARDIRREVFMDEQGYINEFGEEDDRSAHAVGYVGDNAVAVGRLYFDGEKYHIGRIAVRKNYRGNGYGGRIVLAIEEEAAKRGGGRIEISSQLHAKAMYMSLGYTDSGEDSSDEGVAHVLLYKII